MKIIKALLLDFISMALLACDHNKPILIEKKAQTYKDKEIMVLHRKNKITT